MTGSPQVTQTTAALDARTTPDRRRRPRRTTDLTGYARTLAEGLRQAEENQP